jgi:hypothetical protein
MAARRLEVPEVLRRAWGDEAAEAFAVWLAGVLEERAVSRDEFRQILSRLDVLERDVAALQADVRELRREMNERFDRIYCLCFGMPRRWMHWGSQGALSSAMGRTAIRSAWSF